MMRYFLPRFLESTKLLESYSYPSPFHIHLKKWFKGKKKFGSRDRKAIAELCYGYWRVKGVLAKDSIENALYVSSWVYGYMGIEDMDKLMNPRKDWPILPDIPIEERWAYILNSVNASIDTYYPQNLLQPEFLSLNDADMHKFQPLVWLRVGEEKREELANLGFSAHPDVAHAMSGRQVHIPEHRSIQVQDLSSQLILNQIRIDKGMRVWDCCCGSAGKSIPLIREGTEFLLTDKRESILHNARKRLKFYNKKAEIKCLDLSLPLEVDLGKFDFIIADLPCSGSGTWFRNPEHFSNFDYNQLQNYQNLQRRILSNSLPFLKEGGILVYITCSVFDMENRVQMHWLEQECQLVLTDELHLNGREAQSDSMYAAFFTKPSVLRG